MFKLKNLETSLIFSISLVSAFSLFLLEPQKVFADPIETGRGIVIDILTGQLPVTFPKIKDGVINVVVPDDKGGWYIGGTFSEINNVTRNRIAHIFDTGILDPIWNPDVVGDGIYSMYFDSAKGLLYIGGQFSSIKGQERKNVAALDLFTGNPTGWNPGTNGSVYAVVSDPFNSRVYAGGDFSSVGGQSRNRIVAIDALTGLVLGWNPDVGGNAASVRAINVTAASSTVYIGGKFDSVGGQARENIAGIDTSTGFVTIWNPGVNGHVFSLESNYAQKLLYVGGQFSSIGGKEKNNIAAVDVTLGQTLYWNPDANGPVLSLISDANKETLYVGGKFSSIGGQTRNHVAVLDMSTGLAKNLNPNAGDYVFALATSQTKNTLYLGGQFNSIGGKIAMSALSAATSTPPVVATSTLPTAPPISVPTPPTTKFIFQRNLSFGMAGDDVRELQKYLNKNNFPLALSGFGSPINETTYFGNLTRSALTKFQSAHAAELGISAGTGYFGPLTRALINK